MLPVGRWVSTTTARFLRGVSVAPELHARVGRLDTAVPATAPPRSYEVTSNGRTGTLGEAELPRRRVASRRRDQRRGWTPRPPALRGADVCLNPPRNESRSLVLASGLRPRTDTECTCRARRYGVTFRAAGGLVHERSNIRFRIALIACAGLAGRVVAPVASAGKGGNGWQRRIQFRCTVKRRRSRNGHRSERRSPCGLGRHRSRSTSSHAEPTGPGSC